MAELLIGKKICKFVDKETKQEVQYYKLYFTFQDDKITGTGCESQNVSRDVFDKALVGKSYRLVFNRYTKVEDIPEG